MNVISNIMVGTGMALILIGVIGLVLSWVCEKGETAAADAVPAASSEESLEMNEEEARNGDAV